MKRRAFGAEGLEPDVNVDERRMPGEQEERRLAADSVRRKSDSDLEHTESLTRRRHWTARQRAKDWTEEGERVNRMCGKGCCLGIRKTGKDTERPTEREIEVRAWE